MDRAGSVGIDEIDCPIRVRLRCERATELPSNLKRAFSLGPALDREALLET
jgi:hypothetical protein